MPISSSQFSNGANVVPPSGSTRQGLDSNKNPYSSAAAAPNRGVKVGMVGGSVQQMPNPGGNGAMPNPFTSGLSPATSVGSSVSASRASLASQAMGAGGRSSVYNTMGTGMRGGGGMSGEARMGLGGAAAMGLGGGGGFGSMDND